MIAPGDLLALASNTCPWCHGFGQRKTRGGTAQNPVLRPCDCALRAAFRKCLAAYRLYTELIAQGAASLSVTPGIGSYCSGYRAIEYCADFVSVARQALPEAEDWRIFTRHIVGDEPWRRLVTVVGRSDKKYFYDGVYKVMSTLGKAFADAGVFPTAGYFTGRSMEGQMIGLGAHPRAGRKQGLKALPWQVRHWGYRKETAVAAAG